MLIPGTILQGRYRIAGPLGQGGMGTVYQADDLRLETVVAVKESHLSDERLIKQFALEARILAKLRHPALTKVIDHFEESGAQFLVMEYIPGPDLSQLLQQQNGPFPVEQVLQWADQLLIALSYLHAQTPPIIHRDIKPQNLKLTAEGQIILLDFGLAKGLAGNESKVASVYGYTPAYAPLEQIQGTGTEARSDLYSLAATLYQLMTGVAPPDALIRVMDVTNELPDPVRRANELNPRIAPAVAQVLVQGMSLNRERRPASALAMRDLLRDAAKASLSGEDPDKTHVLPAPPSTAETIPARPSPLPPTVAAGNASEQTRAGLPAQQTDPQPPGRTYLANYDQRDRSGFSPWWIAVPVLVLLVLAGLGYGAYRAISSSWSNSGGTSGPPPQTSPEPSPSGSPTPLVIEHPADTPSVSPTPKPTATTGPIVEVTPTPTVPQPTPSIGPPKTVSGGVLNGKAISLPKPVYPPMARAAHASGAVNVQVTVDENGNVISAAAVSGHPLLRASAVSAARGAKFSPTRIGGQPVKVTGVIVYNFVDE